MKHIGPLIRTIRKESGLSQAELARALGVDQTAVSQYETNRIEPSVEVLLRLHALVGRKDAQARIRHVIALRVVDLSEQELDGLLDDIEEGLVTSEPIADLAVLDSAYCGVLDHYDEWRAGRQLVQESTEMVKAGVPVDASLVNLFRIYRQHRGSAEIRQIFRKALAYIEVESRSLATQQTAPKRAKKKSASRPASTGTEDGQTQKNA